jgi:hypothetical protein
MVMDFLGVTNPTPSKRISSRDSEALGKQEEEIQDDLERGWVTTTELIHFSFFFRFVAANSILSPCRVVKSTDFLAHKMIPSCLLNQSIPRITSIPLDVRITKSASKSISPI